jgi:hypothetical protein
MDELKERRRRRRRRRKKKKKKKENIQTASQRDRLRQRPSKR